MQTAERTAGRTVAALGLLGIAVGFMVAAGAAEQAPARPGVVQAASCAQEDVQAAVDAAQDGDVVIVPAGTAAWRTLAARTPAVRISGKAITLQGAGIDKSIIVDETGKLSGEYPLGARRGANQAEGRLVRITGFTFKGMKRRGRAEAALHVGGTNWRVDHCKFDATDGDGRGLWASGRGVVDNCVFINCKQGVATMGDREASWRRALALGTADAVYIEDCTFTCTRPEDGANDAYGGARYVFRHNTVTGVNMGHHGCDSGNYRSTFSFEIYDNVMDGRHMRGQDRAMHFRGGTGVVFNNTLVNYGGIGLSSYRSFRSGGKWGLCDGKNPIDGNEEPNGYPCQDQIGRSTNQILEPLYFWNNTLDGKALRGVGVQDGGKGVIKEGRDYFMNTPRPGYKPYVYPHPYRQQSPPLAADSQPPSPPRNLVARAASARKVVLNWEPPERGKDVAGYYVWRDGVKLTTVSDPTCTQYAMAGLKAPVTQYRFAVSAFDAAGNEGEPSAPAAVVEAAGPEA